MQICGHFIQQVIAKPRVRSGCHAGKPLLAVAQANMGKFHQCVKPISPLGRAEFREFVCGQFEQGNDLTNFCVCQRPLTQVALIVDAFSRQASSTGTDCDQTRKSTADWFSCPAFFCKTQRLYQGGDRIGA